MNEDGGDRKDLNALWDLMYEFMSRREKDVKEYEEYFLKVERQKVEEMQKTREEQAEWRKEDAIRGREIQRENRKLLVFAGIYLFLMFCVVKAVEWAVKTFID